MGLQTGRMPFLAVNYIQQLWPCSVSDRAHTAWVCVESCFLLQSYNAKAPKYSAARAFSM